MDFRLSELQQEVVRTAREFAEKELLPKVLERDQAQVYSMEVWKRMGELGLLGLPYPKEYGGSGAGYMEYALALMELAKVDASVAISYSISTSVAVGGIYHYGSEEQKKRFMPALLSGECIGAFGLTEPDAGSDASNIKTIAEKQGDYYLLNGMKCFTTNGPVARYYFVIASTNPELKTKGLSAFIVDMQWEGVRIGKIENKMGLNEAQVSEVYFDNVRVPKDHLLGQEGKGFNYAMASLDCGRIGVAAQGLGIAIGAFDAAKKYMEERRQFGQELYKNQYMAFRMATLAAKIEQARLLLFRAAWLHDVGEPYSVAASMAKLMCTDLAMEVSTEAVQFLGGNGYMKEYHVERMMRDAKITQIYEGTNEIQRLVIANSLFRRKK
ncbi:MAG: acyl-CoA dehydrogenase family protein [Ndongobacter sp.]|nr:acyl-CoA dehydrogenase family protein [Ndongobacter sp.]